MAQTQKKLLDQTFNQYIMIHFDKIIEGFYDSSMTLSQYMKSRGFRCNSENFSYILENSRHLRRSNVKMNCKIAYEEEVKNVTDYRIVEEMAGVLNELSKVEFAYRGVYMKIFKDVYGVRRLFKSKSFPRKAHESGPLTMEILSDFLEAVGAKMSAIFLASYIDFKQFIFEMAETFDFFSSLKSRKKIDDIWIYRVLDEEGRTLSESSDCSVEADGCTERELNEYIKIKRYRFHITDYAKYATCRIKGDNFFEFIPSYKRCTYNMVIGALQGLYKSKNWGVSLYTYLERCGIKIYGYDMTMMEKYLPNGNIQGIRKYVEEDIEFFCYGKKYEGFTFYQKFISSLSAIETDSPFFKRFYMSCFVDTQFFEGGWKYELQHSEYRSTPQLVKMHVFVRDYVGEFRLVIWNGSKVERRKYEINTTFALESNIRFWEGVDESDTFMEDYFIDIEGDSSMTITVCFDMSFRFDVNAGQRKSSHYCKSCFVCEDENGIPYVLSDNVKFYRHVDLYTIYEFNREHKFDDDKLKVSKRFSAARYELLESRTEYDKSIKPIVQEYDNRKW